MNINAHWLLSKVTQIQHFKTSFPKTTLGQLNPNFVLSLHGILGWKFVQMFRVTWPKMASRLIYGKNLENKILLRNQEADDLETWYTASGTQVLSNFFKWRHWLTLPIFMTWSNLFRDASAWVKAYTAYSHIFRRYSNSAYPMHSRERYRTYGPLVCMYFNCYDSASTLY